MVINNNLNSDHDTRHGSFLHRHSPYHEDCDKVGQSNSLNEQVRPLSGALAAGGKGSNETLEDSGDQTNPPRN